MRSQDFGGEKKEKEKNKKKFKRKMKKKKIKVLLAKDTSTDWEGVFEPVPKATPQLQEGRREGALFQGHSRRRIPSSHSSILPIPTRQNHMKLFSTFKVFPGLCLHPCVHL